MSEEKDLKQIGGPGIDTQYERDLINYRPDISYEKPMVNTKGGLSTDTASQKQELKKINNSIPLTSLWGEVVDVINKINNLEEQLSTKLKDVSSKFPSRRAVDIIGAAERLGYQITDSIPFELYKETFNHLGSGDAEIIKDAYEDYQADVSGILVAELYADAKEMQQDWEDMIPFINKGLFGQVVSEGKYPTSIKKDDTNLQAIQSSDQQISEEYAQALKLAKVNEEIMYHLMTNEYGSDRYYQIEEELKNDRRRLDNLRRKINTRNEILDLIRRKASNASDGAEFINNSIDFSPYKGKEHDVLYHILRQYAGKEDMAQGLRKLQAVLKLSIDNKKTSINGTKGNLRGIAGRHTKNKINRTLVNGIHLRNEIFGDVYDIMQYFDGVPKNRTFEDVANHIAQGTTQAEDSYHSQSMDFYKIHSMDAELRNRKLKGLIDKDSARSIYKMIEGVLKFIRQSGKWPSKDNLSQWFDGFLEYYKSL